jgi:hypothetical protein
LGLGQLFLQLLIALRSPLAQIPKPETVAIPQSSLHPLAGQRAITSWRSLWFVKIIWVNNRWGSHGPWATDQRFVTRDQAITNMEIHQVSDMLDLFTPNIVMILDDIPHPLFVNIIGPPRVI